MRLQLIAAADTICRRLSRETLAGRPKNSSFAEIKRVVPRNVRLERAALAELGKLVPPSSLSRQWGVLLLYRRELSDQLAKLLEAAEHEDGSAVGVVATKIQREHQLLLLAAAHIGLRYCGMT